MDPVADMLNQIKNAQAVGKETVSLPFSNLKYAILQVLEKQGLIGKAEKKGRGTNKVLEVSLKYESPSGRLGNEQGRPLISGLKKISRPSQRTFSGAKAIKSASRSRGLVIISTSRGLMAAKEAKKNNLGGEVICEIW